MRRSIIVSQKVAGTIGFGTVWEGFGANHALTTAGANNANVVIDGLMRDTWCIISDSSMQTFVWDFHATYISSNAVHANHYRIIFGR